MKTKTFATMVSLLAAGAFAVGIHPFTSWDDISKKSPDIIVARCTVTTPDGPVGNGMIWSDIEVLSVLKGEARRSREEETGGGAQEMTPSKMAKQLGWKIVMPK